MYIGKTRDRTISSEKYGIMTTGNMYVYVFEHARFVLLFH